MKLSKLPRGGDARKLGFRNGDIVHAVNDIEIKTSHQMSLAAEEAANASEVEVRLTRRGEETTLYFWVQSI